MNELAGLFFEKYNQPFVRRILYLMVLPNYQRTLAVKVSCLPGALMPDE